MRPSRQSRLRVALPLFGAIAALLAVVPTAQATFHLIKVREIYAGTDDDSYVELQMYAPGQNFLAGHSLTIYDSAGSVSHASTFSTGVAGAENQRTVLIGDSGVQAAFGTAPDLVDPALTIPGEGGAACWNAGGVPADCVAWGNFNGGAALQMATGTSAGTPASPAGIAAGKAIRRLIAPGCPSLLEEGDDTDTSSTDFIEVTPAPRNNGAAIVEATCPGVPETAIDDTPPLRSKNTSAEFTYDSPTATSYECRLDAALFAACPPGGPQGYTGLADGTHTFQVRGVNSSGPDPTPASFTWTVDTVAPSATIDNHPLDPSPGASAAFTFHASESATFQCSLVPVGQLDSFSGCTSGKTYSALANGEYIFKARPTDLAGNPGAPASFSWEVDNSLADTTPPQTTIDSRPGDPSTSSTAVFTYSSNETGSTFQCALDGSGFAPCPAAGSVYADLANGPHAFQVRAVDTSGNIDPSPAGCSFSVFVVASAAPALPPATARPTAAPQTVLSGKPAAKTHDRTPTFRFRSDLVGATFECAIDRRAFKSCRSPFTTMQLTFGRHSVSVRAVAAGLADPTPEKLSFKVVRRG